MMRPNAPTTSAGMVNGVGVQHSNRVMVQGSSAQVRQQVPGGFVQQRPQQAQQPTSQQQQQQQQEQTDPILRVKSILPHLKEALVNLMAVASQNFAVSVGVDDMQKGVDGSSVPRFDKCLEHFYTLCDQLELQLMVAHQQLSQTFLSMQQAPLLHNVNFKSNPNGPQLYNNYVNTVEMQLRFAKEIHGYLTKCCNMLAEHQTTHPTL